MAASDRGFRSGQMPEPEQQPWQQNSPEQLPPTQYLSQDVLDELSQNTFDYSFLSCSQERQTLNEFSMIDQSPRFVPNFERPTADNRELYDISQYANQSFDQEPFNPVQLDQGVHRSVNLTLALRDEAHANTLLPDSGYTSPFDILSTKSAPVTFHAPLWDSEPAGKRVRRSQPYLSPIVPVPSRRTQRSSTTAGSLGFCSECIHLKKPIRSFRNDSDKKKHMLTHTRPFQCDLGACRQQPSCFATVNDLSRHQKSCHGIVSSQRSEYYKCRIPNCPKFEKLHDRRDNFKNHIDRTHINTSKVDQQIAAKDVEYWVKQSLYQPTDAELDVHYNSKQRRSRAPASNMGTTIDASSIGQSHEPEIFNAPSPQQQSAQWMTEHSNFADFSFSTQTDSQPSQYPSFEAQSSLHTIPSISLHPSPALDPINEALIADLSDLNMDLSLNTYRDTNQITSSSLPDGFSQNLQGLGLGNVADTADGINPDSVFDAGTVVAQDMFPPLWNFGDLADDNVNGLDEEELKLFGYFDLSG